MVKTIMDKYEYDPERAPEGCIQFAVVSGSWYDMGRQYAMQCREGLVARTADLISAFLRRYGDMGAVTDVCERYIVAAKTEFPQLVELLKGMAAVTGLSWQEMVVTLYGKSMLRAETEGEQAAADRECSQIAAWGSMTVSGHMIAAGNMDLPFDARDYLPTIVAFPEDGYSFVSSDMFHRAGINEKGLMVQGSGGQNAGSGDMIREADRHMWNDAFIYSLAYCDSTREALEHHKKWKYITGCNQGFGDLSHDAAIVEFTAGKYFVRRAGDFGEHDYLLANNGCNIPEMQSSLMTGKDYWTDCLPRYWSAEQYIRERSGEVSASTLYEAQSLNSFYIPAGWTLRYRKDWDNTCWYRDENAVTGSGWHDEWAPEYNNWALQCRDFSFRTTVRHVIDVENLSFYIQKGCRESELSAQPDTTGTFCRIQLGGGVYDILDRAKSELEQQIWCAARDCINGGGGYDNTLSMELRRERLNEAKKCIYTGINYMSLAINSACETTVDESNLMAGKALSAFAKGQCMARSARNFPAAFDLR